jgi:hypothetical protein
VKNGPEKWTIIAEATIKCHELFQVKDASRGSVLQGMEDSSEQEEVVHIVWFKIVTDESQDGAGKDIVSWKIGRKRQERLRQCQGEGRTIPARLS